MFRLQSMPVLPRGSSFLVHIRTEDRELHLRRTEIEREPLRSSSSRLCRSPLSAVERLRAAKTYSNYMTDPASGSNLRQALRIHPDHRH